MFELDFSWLDDFSERYHEAMANLANVITANISKLEETSEGQVYLQSLFSQPQHYDNHSVQARMWKRNISRRGDLHGRS